MLRSIVLNLSRICGGLAACFLALIAVATILQVVARQFGQAVETTELSGFFLAASTFLGLAYTFINGGHVRISLVSQFASERVRRPIELWACGVALAVTGFATWHMIAFTYETYSFGDLSPGLLAVPLWIPQSALAFGLLVLMLAIVEQGALVIAGRPAGYAINIDGTAE
ncbi:TRAP transporter small permease [Pikeienuella piscinae]|uniref:TRAP transporter small permease protein n=1 Tax=Pikeienuella piscinae TaxID=2748098 RepID=A0A7M3T606_9RHOB|nr:TRAP transporter small permease [Pikeienuella piscinae]QIE57437.1 TRAP transporter small permease [Pikeienuella piscinae]